MKKIVLVCGLIGGAISTTGFLYTMLAGNGAIDFENSMYFGFASMFLAFSLIFVGIKSYRDKQLGGSIRFGKAFLTGLYISLVTSTVYVLVWLFYNYTFAPDFMEKYTEYSLSQLRAAGASEERVAEEALKMKGFAEMYSNPLFNALMTYMEILPIGIVISAVAALILKRKEPGAPDAIV